jgi:hypothetical protein
MSAWVVIPSLLKLRDEFNLVSPKRDKGSDGTIGDSSHTSSSDHTPDEDSSKLRNKDADHTNEVHALDIDSTGPWPDGKRGDIKGSWFDQKIHMIIATEKKRWEDPKDMCRLNYIIWCGVIYDKDNDWVGVPYHGTSDPHTGHAHFSARYETRAESDIRSWGVYVPPKPVNPPSEDLPVDQGTFNKLMLGFMSSDAGKKAVAEAVAEMNIGSKAVPQRTLRQGMVDLTGQLRPIFTFPPTHPENVQGGLPADAPVRKLLNGDGTVHAS